MLTKPSRNRDAADIAVDNPAKAMDQFTKGLRRVLAAPKPPARKRDRASKKRQR